jgi:S-adenosylmethionine:tRNA ribosyltransferase-isomerase
VDAILTGVHQAGTSHHELLRAFADDATLQRAEGELESGQFRTHEFGDSMLVEKASFHNRASRSRDDHEVFF